MSTLMKLNTDVRHLKAGAHYVAHLVCTDAEFNGKTVTLQSTDGKTVVATWTEHSEPQQFVLESDGDFVFVGDGVKGITGELVVMRVGSYEP